MRNSVIGAILVIVALEMISKNEVMLCCFYSFARVYLVRQVRQPYFNQKIQKLLPTGALF